MIQILNNGLLELGFSDSLDSISKKLEQYINEIILFNSAYNLVNTSNPEEIAVNHILDSLAPYKKIAELALKSSDSPKNVKIADIGSGGGLPGIPLAIVLPDFSFTLIERMDKRCAFLENCAAILGLKNVTVLKREAEKAPKEFFDVVTFRAFRPLEEKMTKTILSLSKKGGFIAAFKAKSTSIKEEMNAISHIVPNYTVEPIYVPFLTDSVKEKEARERNLVVVSV